MIRNPILPGFRPDPSIVRVGNDFVLATSTFEWWPGVALHHSRDLHHWRRLGHVVTRPSQLDLRGVPDSGGLWAPSISHAHGRWWCVVSRLRTTGAGRPFKDCAVLLFTAEDPAGPWSDATMLDAIGFDPSLFHDHDGRSWLLNLQWDHRPGRFRFAGIVARELDRDARCLVGPRLELLRKDILCEGPNLYRRDGRYHLLLAEGGTGWNHGIAQARADRLEGPWELDPEEALLTTRHDPTWPLQKAGHGELVDLPDGSTWLVHLASRPVGPERRCVLGRETALQRVVRAPDGWLRLAHGDVRPAVDVEAPAGLPEHPWPAESPRDDFDAPTLGPSWCSLRVAPTPDWLDLASRPGWLVLVGREAPHSQHEQSLVAKRWESIDFTVTTRIDANPATFRQMAGLVLWYDTRTHLYLRVTRDDAGRRVASLATSIDGVWSEPAEAVVPLPETGPVRLRAVVAGARVRFHVAPDDGDRWVPVGGEQDGTVLSDDFGTGLHFTGAMAGLAAHDVEGTRFRAAFDCFDLEPFNVPS